MKCLKRILFSLVVFMLLFNSCKKVEIENDVIPGKIVFNKNGNVCTINPDGTNQQIIASENDYVGWRHSPWSNDAEWITFQRRYSSGRKSDICIIKQEGSGFKNLTNDTIHNTLPHWSPDGKRLVFGRMSPPGDIFVINIDGTGLKRLTDYSGHDSEAAWSPMGNKIAFLRDYDLWIMNPDGSNQTMITDNTTVQKFAWSPDGSKIVFHGQSRNGIFDIYLLNSDGTSLENLTDNPSDDSLGAWSPDGNRIAFSSKRDGNYEIYLINVDGTGLLRVTNNTVHESRPTWSPDGKWLCFARYDNDGNSNLYLINVEGTIEYQISNTTGGEYWPYWSPR